LSDLILWLNIVRHLHMSLLLTFTKIKHKLNLRISVFCPSLEWPHLRQ